MIRYLDHDADVGFEVAAATLESLWALAAQALIGVMTDVDRVESRCSRSFEVEAPDLAAALVESLSELLFHFEVEGLLLSHVDRLETAPTHDGCRVSFDASGQFHDPALHTVGSGVKAVTHHGAEVEQRPDGTWRAQVLLDL